MNNIVDMINYYLVHKNADDSIIKYLKNKLDNSNLEDLIIIQIKLLYTDPTDKMVSDLIYYITLRINNILSNIDLYDLSYIISLLNNNKKTLLEEINNLKDNNSEILKRIQKKDFDKDSIKTDNELASELINKMQTNNFIIDQYNSEIKSIDIWISNLKNCFDKKLNTSKIKQLLENYIHCLALLDRDDFINEFIYKMSSKIDERLLNNNLFETITNIIPELHILYKENSVTKNELYKLIDYYIDIIEINLKQKINKLSHIEKIILKEKLDLICQEFLSNDRKDDDFKALVIKNYLRYL